MRSLCEHTPAAALLLAIMLPLGCSWGPSSQGNCTELASAFETDIEKACRGPFGVRSPYCFTCVKNKLFSYQKQGAGVCVCAPLAFTDDVCAANRDDGKATAAIVAADSECATYSLDKSDAGDATGGTGATGATAGTEPLGGGGVAGG